jgi:hypothetical protein
MAADETEKPEHASGPPSWPVTQAPMMRAADGGCLMELAGGLNGPEVDYERVGGIARISGTAVLRHPLGDVRAPVTIVIRHEDAKKLAPNILGRLTQIM